MYIYHALIKALSTHIIHINLNMIFYTHVEHSPTRTVYIKYYMEKQTRTLQTHTHTLVDIFLAKPGEYRRMWKEVGQAGTQASFMSHWWREGLGVKVCKIQFLNQKDNWRKFKLRCQQINFWLERGLGLSADHSFRTERGTGFVCRPQLLNWKGNWVCLQTTAFELKGELGLSAVHSF